MSAMATLRQGIRAELATDLGIQMVDGMLNAPAGIARRDLGCVWVPGFGEKDDDVDTQMIDVRIRIYQQKIEQRNPEDPVDPTKLEDFAEAVELALRDKQAGQFGVWFFRVRATEIDLESQGVEMSVIAMRANPFPTGG